MEKNRIEYLKNYISSFQTKDILGYIGTLLTPFGNSGKEVADSADIFVKTSLMAPMKQYLYLAGILISTEYKGDNAKTFGLQERDHVECLLKEITDEYSINFIKSSVTNSMVDKQMEKKDIISAFEYFDAYFNTGSLAYPEQIIEKIEILFRKFDNEISTFFGLDLNDFIDFYHFIYDKQKESFDNVQNYLDLIGKLFETKREFSNEQEIVDLLKDSKIDKKELEDLVGKVSCVSLLDLRSKFGLDKSRILCSLLCAKREKRDFMFYTDNNPFIEKPLIFTDDNYIFVTFAPLLLDAIYILLFNFLKEDGSFAKSRGIAIEAKTISLLKKILPGCVIYKNVCEIPNTFEHDILIDFDEFYFIVEVKASKIRMPLFNPEKCLQRLKDHFFSEVGIGYAYNQAIRLKKLFDLKTDITLYVDKNRKTVFKPKNKIIPIVVTLENFGAIQINYSNLLKPEKDQPYAWCVNIPDLENIIEINTYLSKTSESFIKYVLFRIKRFVQIIATDELQILESFYQNKIKGLKRDAAILIEPSGKSLIDKIYFEKNGIPYEYNMNNFNY